MAGVLCKTIFQIPLQTKSWHLPEAGEDRPPWYRYSSAPESAKHDRKTRVAYDSEIHQSDADSAMTWYLRKKSYTLFFLKQLLI